MLEEIIKKRNIKRLFHFTRAENLFSIFEYEILPRSELNKRNIPYLWNNEGIKWLKDQCLL